MIWLMDALEFIKIREKLGWNQKEMAKALGVHVSTVNKWESGENPIKKIVEIAVRTVIKEKPAA